MISHRRSPLVLIVDDDATTNQIIRTIDLRHQTKDKEMVWCLLSELGVMEA